MKGKHLKIMNWVIIPVIIVVLLALSNTSDLKLASAKGHEQMESKISKDIKKIAQNNDESNDLSHEQITVLTAQFMKILVQDVDDKYKVKNYDTKEALIKAFEQISTRDVAEPYVDFFYKEETDGLYIVPTETPPWFVEENDYDMVQLDSNKVKVRQDNQMDLYGPYTIEIEFTFDDEWRITDIKHS